jgi:sec-independent protein translocase protein TatA
MVTLIGMPQGAEWLIILAIVVLLFGSAKLPTLVRQLGKSKKIWEEEVGPGKKKSDGELTQGAEPTTAYPPVPQAPVQQPYQQAPGTPQPYQQAPSQQAPVQQPLPPNQVNGQTPGDGQPPTRSAN